MIKQRFISFKQKTFLTKFSPKKRIPSFLIKIICLLGLIIVIFADPALANISTENINSQKIDLKCSCQNEEEKEHSDQEQNTTIIQNLESKTVSKEKIDPPSGEIAIIIDVTKRTLSIFSDNELFKQYPCAVGKPETPTPVGNWQVNHKAMNWGTGFGTRWHGLNVPWGIYGIHGTNKPGSIGSYASHGCIRMWNKNVEEIYPWIPKGTPVYIVGNPFGVHGNKNTIVNGSRGSDVLLVQKRLKQWGYLKGAADGVFGYGTEAALKAFQKDFNLKVDGQVNLDDYEALKLR